MESQQRRQPPNTFTLVLIGIFAAAVAITLFVGLRSDNSAASSAGSSTDTSFTDLGDYANNDPDTPSDLEPAPQFSLPTLEGGTFDLGEHLAADGRPVVLNLWASWCPPCRAEMPDINTAAAQHPEVAFVGVAVQDEDDKAMAFAEEIGVAYTIAFDDGQVDDAYNVIALPGTFFIDSDGTLVKSHFGVVTVDSLDTDIAELFGS